MWLNPPEDMLPGVVPVELVIGRSEQAVVMLTGIRAFPTGLAMNVAVRAIAIGPRSTTTKVQTGTHATSTAMTPMTTMRYSQHVRCEVAELNP